MSEKRVLTEKDGFVREAGRVVEITPIAVCVTCMSVVKPVKVKYSEVRRGWKYFEHEHPLSVVRLKRSGCERWIEYSGEELPDWLRLSIERMWHDWHAPPEEVAYKVRVLLDAYRLLVKVLRCYGANSASSQVRLPIVKSVHEPDWLNDFMWRLYLNIPRAHREMCSEG